MGDDDESDEEKVNLLHQFKRKKLRHSINESSISIKEYENRLRARYKQTFTNTQWASINTTKNKEEEEYHNVLSNAESILLSNNNKKYQLQQLPPNQIKTLRHPDINRE